jgi:nucleotide-binding universal stress UspA family protein
MRSERQLPCKVARVSPTFARILCPTDFGDSSLEALDLARALTAYHDATLYVLHVSQPNGDRLQEAPHGGTTGMETASATLDELFAKRLGGARHHCFIAAGDPAGKIVEMSRGIRADLVVIGTRAQSTFGRVFLGSVTERVLEESDCPVLVTFRK